MRSDRALLQGVVLACALCTASLVSAQAQPGAAQQPVPAPTSGAQPGAVEPPALLEHVVPEYPPTANGESASFELGLTLDREGTLLDVQVLSRTPERVSPELEEAALAAAKKLRFQPARRDGAPIAARIVYRMRIAPPELGVLDAAATRAPGEPTNVGAADTADTTSDVAPAADARPGATAAAAVSSPEAKGPSAADGGGVSTDGAAPEFGATGRSRTLPAPPARSASDFFVPVGKLAAVPRANASDFLRLAPGIALTNEGGEGHAERVYLRGFDAREGQDLEFTLDGVPINDVGNPHGEGYADTHFILPELVRAVRVVEGPFDPHQGNYAVAGSAEYVLGLERRGTSLSLQAGSFDTQRLLLTWAPAQERTGTFVGADVRRSAGFGQNRAAELGRALGQYELQLGEARLLRVLASSYATRYGSAGVVREDDLNTGTQDFYGTYDPTQGGDAQRHGFALTFEEKHTEWTLRQQVFVTLRNMRLRENFTGFLEDPPEPFRSGSAQRGDMVDQAFSAVSVGARGSLRETRTVLGLPQSLELGYYARHDTVDSSQRRLRWKTVVPYRVDFDYTHAVTNLGLYGDLELRPLRFISLRGGLRSDLFAYDTLDRCALHDTVLNAASPVLDQLCYVRDRVGPRDPSSRRSASGVAWQPRGTLIVGPFADLNLVAALGSGARAADPSYIADGDRAPFSRITAAEGGVTWSRELSEVSVNLRGLYYYTHVGQDLIFNQQEGRNTLAPGTQRQGALLAARVYGSFFDVSASGTYAYARFEQGSLPAASAYRPADEGTRVPYIPSWVTRLDAAFFKQLPGLRVLDAPVTARASLGLSYTSPRALTYGEQGQATFLADVAAGVLVGALELGVSIQNLFNERYRLAEYNYVSEFRAGAVAPNLLPVRHFSAGAPRTLMFTLTVHLGGRSQEGP